MDSNFDKGAERCQAKRRALRRASTRGRFLATSIAACIALLSISPSAWADPAADGAPADDESEREVIVVTATKLPEELKLVPVMITVVTGDELRARGADDLRTALSLVSGVDVSPGGDAGPAGSAPALWGLREFDAFLLVVDGVPWGGAFNPALATLDLDNVERIEVLRGAAPVSYGATSFVGAVHVLHYPPGKTPGHASASAGNRDTGLFSGSFDLPRLGAVRHSLTVNGETRKFSQDDAKIERIHALYRAAADLGFGRVHLDLDVTGLRQDPYSPHPRGDGALTERFPLDANTNPSDAEQDQDRFQLNAGLFQRFVAFDWTTQYSVSYTDARNVRGFLREEFATDGTTTNADGFAQSVFTTDMYFDTYLSTRPVQSLGVVVGLDWLYGRGQQRSANFEYAVRPDGSNRPESRTIPIDELTRLRDRRNFAGAYSQIDWRPGERWDVIAGVRLNGTFEKRDGAVTSTHPDTPPQASSDDRDQFRPSGMVGASYALWVRERDRVAAFANYRNTFKPAAVDFGPEAEGKILEPEKAQSWEAGLRGRLLEGRLDWAISYFRMDFENLVIAENVQGLPGKANAGEQRFQGVEIESGLRIVDDLLLAVNYSYHSSKFTDFARLRPDGSLQQLSGKYLELSPKQLGGVGIVYAPPLGVQASVVWRYIGSRFLNKANTAAADAFHTVDAGAGYRFALRETAVTLRINGHNLTDVRDPVTESELGDAQFYRMPGRTVLGSLDVDF